MILADASAWIEYDRATNSPSDRILNDLIETGGADLACTEPVLMEVLAGARDETRQANLRRLLTSFAWLSVESATDFAGAAKVYGACRRAGISPRGLLDCMIAAIALRSGAQILSPDRDFAAMATVLPLRLAAPSVD